MTLKIAISSGKGGTGKTFISTNIAKVLEKMGEQVRYLDCDVEEPNGHLFLKPEIQKQEDVLLLSPMGVNEEKCTSCGKCIEACKYNALALINKNVLFFKNLCHICGACRIVCPENAIIEESNSDFLGTIPYDKAITKAQMEGISVVEYTDNEMTNQIKVIWNNIKNSCFNNDK